VPVSPLALDLVRKAKGLSLERINDIRRLDGQPPLVRLEAEHPLFISRLRKIQPVNPEALTRAMVKNCREVLGYELTPHDLRRTAYTLMGVESIAATRFIRERIANHVEQGVATHYDHYEYLSEKRAVLNAWGGYLVDAIPEAQLADAANVVSLAGTSDA